MRVKIVHPVLVRLQLEPGDELILKSQPEGLGNLLHATRVDGAKFVRVLNEDGSEITLRAAEETATTSRGTRGRPPSAA